MMKYLYDVFVKRCIICKKRDRNLSKVPQYGIYGDKNKHYYFHKECIKNVLKEPQDYDSIIVDRALLIIDLVDTEREKNKQRDERARKCYNSIYSLDDKRRSHLL